ncbi:MAG: hypothetical protein LUQ65_03820 [Candidatus Helarchaeota archaeon]|nr:hypothetical protein [Candidatus Helarchaeota archaeon]
MEPAQNIDSIAKEIVSKMGNILGVRIHLAIMDRLGNSHYMDRELEPFKSFLTTFVSNNFRYLKVGDHSLPISGKNIMFFRTSDKVMIILYSAKGRIGQFLSFKSMMPKYQQKIDELVADVEPEVMGIDFKAGKLGAGQVALVKPVERVIFSRRTSFYQGIYPKLEKKIKESDKFNLTVSIILNYSNGQTNLLDLIDKHEIKEEEFYTEFYKLFKAKWIKIPDFELYQISCPVCKSMSYRLVPPEFLDKSPHNAIRFQQAGACGHAYYTTIDKKQKIKTKQIAELKKMRGEIEFTNLSIEKLIEFFGEDVFFSLFHAIFFKYSVLFLESGKNAEKISEFMKNFFPQVVYGTQIQSITKDEFLKQNKKYTDFLVIDLISNIIINEPYESEDFDFEAKLFRNILKEKDNKVQILKTYSEFERLILHIDSLLNEIEMYKEIKEDELINLMKTKHDILLERSEIPVIKELADIYYGVDIRKKIIKTLVGQVSDWFESI